MVASQEKTLNMMRRILHKRLSNDAYIVEHTQRVTEISLSLGKEIGLPPDELEDLYWGAMLHDIGKIAVDPEILNKPGALTPEEYRHIMTHAILSLNIAKNMFNERVLEIIFHHHDYYDGSGFNQTIAGEEIPLGARVLALADAFDAMTSDRPYRAAMSHEEAFVEIRRCRGTQFDPGVASAFLKMHLFPRPVLQYAMAKLKEDREMKKIIEDGQKRPLEEFAQCAVIYLAQHPECDEVMQQANHIIEMEHDTITSPSLIYELPEGYEYNSSEVIGVSRKHKRLAPSQKSFSTL